MRRPLYDGGHAWRIARRLAFMYEILRGDATPRLRTYKRLIIGHAGFKTLTPLRRFIMSKHFFWLSEAQFDRLRPLLPNKVRGVPRGR